jgi:hypothetical protein
MTLERNAHVAVANIRQGTYDASLASYFTPTLHHTLIADSAAQANRAEKIISLCMFIQITS